MRGSFTFTCPSATSRLEPALDGGSIWDVGCYPISYARFIVGAEPIEVFGCQVPGQTGVDETFTGQLRFPGHVHAQFDSSFRAPFRTHMEIVGSEGAISITRPFKPDPEEHLLINRGDQIEKIAVTGPGAVPGRSRGPGRRRPAGKPTRISLADSRANVATIVALLQSAVQGQPIAMA